MSLLFMDGFDTYAVAGSFLSGNRWASFGPGDGSPVHNYVPTSGVKGGPCLQMTNSFTHMYKNLSAVHNTLIVGFWFLSTTNHAGVRHFILLTRDSAATTQSQVVLAINASEQFELYRGNLVTLLAAGTTVLAQNRWYYAELKVNMADAGSYELRINGVTEFSGSTDCQALGSSGADWVRLFHNGVDAGSYFIDDIYVSNDAGSAPQNDFLGPHYITTLKPTADNSVTGTPSSGGTNALMVDEATANLDTDYVTHSAAGTDLYDLGNLPTSPSQISAVQVTSVTKKTNSGTLTARNKLKSNATTSNGTTQGMGPEYNWWGDIFETDPDGGIAWTPSKVNAAVAGIERVT